MKELKEISSNYAMERSNDLFSQVVAKAYADGYRQGYKDREDEIPVDLRVRKIEFVDLGLPSGTMWSADFEKDGNDIAYVPYEKAQKHEIPTSEQCAELFGNCKFMKKDNLFYCIGPNGNYVTFALLGYKELDNEQATYTVASLFWICNDNEKNNNTARLLDMRGITKDTYKEFTGNKIPIRLVCKK